MVHFGVLPMCIVEEPDFIEDGLYVLFLSLPDLFQSDVALVDSGVDKSALVIKFRFDFSKFGINFSVCGVCQLNLGLYADEVVLATHELLLDHVVLHLRTG